MDKQKTASASSAYFISTEENEQAALFHWAKLNANNYPELKLLYAVPNAGKRGPLARNHMLRTGLQAGVPDVCLPIPRAKYGALYIEMKMPTNKPTPKQLQWIAALREFGNCVVIAHSWVEAQDMILKYLKLPKP
jgi:VRR-NUC domain